MRLFDSKKLLHRAAAFLMGAVIVSTQASAYASTAKALDSLPASDTNIAMIGMISTAGSTNVGAVRTTEEMSKAKADIEAKKAAEEAARKAEEARKAAEKAAAEEAARKAALAYQPSYGGKVAPSAAYPITDAIKANGKPVGNFKLTFYCPDAACSGPYGDSTASGKRATEGRTIAVDRRVIPMGSKVYIEGFGHFIAEDVGGAIKGNRIDIFVTEHGRAKQLGVKYANIYIMN